MFTQRHPTSLPAVLGQPNTGTTPSDTMIFGIRIGHGVRIQCLLLAGALPGSRVVFREDLLSEAGLQTQTRLRSFFLADPGNSHRYFADPATAAGFKLHYDPALLLALRAELAANPPRRVVFFDHSFLSEVMPQIADLIAGAELHHVEPDRRPQKQGGAGDWLDFSGLPLPVQVHYPTELRPARLTFRYTAPELRKLPHGLRELDYVAHGGGWAMGDFRERLTQLRGRGAILLPRDRALAEAATILPRARLFHDVEVGADRFAQLAEVTAEGTRLHAAAPHHGALQVIARARAIVSKPGGGSVVDAYLAGTPILYLDPISLYEQGNAEFIEATGIGMSLERFMAAGQDPVLLERCASRLHRLVQGVPTLHSLFSGADAAVPAPRRAMAAG